MLGQEISGTAFCATILCGEAGEVIVDKWGATEEPSRWQLGSKTLVWCLKDLAQPACTHPKICELYILLDNNATFEFFLPPLWVIHTGTLSLFFTLGNSYQVHLSLFFTLIYIGVGRSLFLFSPHTSRIPWMALMLKVCWQLTLFLRHMIWVILPRMDDVFI